MYLSALKESLKRHETHAEVNETVEKISDFNKQIIIDYSQLHNIQFSSSS